MDLLPCSTSPAVGGGGEPAPVVAGQSAGDAPAVGPTSSYSYPQAERAPDSSTPHQGVGGGEPAVGGVEIGTVEIPPWNPEYSTTDVELFRKFSEWHDLMSWVKKSLRVASRQTLTVHTTPACQPNKANGPAGGRRSASGSLKFSGLETCFIQPLLECF